MEDSSKINTPLDIGHVPFLLHVLQIGIGASIDDEASRHTFGSTMHTILVDNSVIRTAFRNLSHKISGPCASVIKPATTRTIAPRTSFFMLLRQSTSSSMSSNMKGPSIPRNKPRSQAANLRLEPSSCRYSHKNCISCGHQYKHGTSNSELNLSPALAWKKFYREITEHYDSCPRALRNIAPPTSAIRDTLIETELPIQPKRRPPSPLAFPIATASTCILARFPPSEGSKFPPLHQHKRKLTQLQDDIVQEFPLIPDRQVEDSMPVPHASNTFPPASPEDTITQTQSRNVRTQQPAQKFKKNIMDWKIRKEALEADPMLDIVEKKRVHCTECNKWIRLDARNDYYPGLWRKHRKHHLQPGISGSTENRNNEEQLLEDATEQPARKRRAVESTHPEHPQEKSRT